MTVLTNEQARRLRDTLESMPGFEAVGNVIGRAIADGNTIIIGGHAIPAEKKPEPPEPGYDSGGGWKYNA